MAISVMGRNILLLFIYIIYNYNYNYKLFISNNIYYQITILDVLAQESIELCRWSRLRARASSTKKAA